MERIILILVLAAGPVAAAAADGAGSFDLDGAAEKLRKGPGGEWTRRTIRIGGEAITVLEGRVLLGASHIKGEWFRVYPFRFDRDGRRLIWQAPPEHNAPEFVAGAGSGTVVGLLGPTKLSRAVVEALGLEEVNIDASALHHAEQMEKNFDAFVMHVRLHAPGGPPPGLTITGRKLQPHESPIWPGAVAIDRAAGLRLIHHLCEGGYLSSVKGLDFEYPKGPACTVTVPEVGAGGKGVEFYTDLGLSQTTLARLSAMRRELDGPAGEGLDAVIKSVRDALARRGQEPAPAQPAPAEPEVARADPVMPVPAKPDPERLSPAKPSPAAPDLARLGPVTPEPAKPVPAERTSRPDPVRRGPSVEDDLSDGPEVQRLRAIAKKLAAEVGGQWRLGGYTHFGIRALLVGEDVPGLGSGDVVAVLPVGMDRLGKTQVFGYLQTHNVPQHVLGVGEALTVVTNLADTDRLARRVAGALDLAEAPARLVDWQLVQRCRAGGLVMNIQHIPAPPVRAGRTPVTLALTSQPIHTPQGWTVVRIDAEQQAALLDRLLDDGFFRRATDQSKQVLRTPEGPAVVVSVSGQGIPPVMYAESLGWDAATYARLVRLREGLEGEAGKTMDHFLARLDGPRKAYAAAGAPAAQSSRLLRPSEPPEPPEPPDVAVAPVKRVEPPEPPEPPEVAVAPIKRVEPPEPPEVAVAPIKRVEPPEPPEVAVVPPGPPEPVVAEPAPIRPVAAPETSVGATIEPAPIIVPRPGPPAGVRPLVGPLADRTPQAGKSAPAVEPMATPAVAATPRAAEPAPAATTAVLPAPPGEPSPPEAPTTHPAAAAGRTAAEGISGQVVHVTEPVRLATGGEGGRAISPLSVRVHVFRGRVKPFKTPDPNHAALVRTVRSGADGQFRCELPPGTYTVVAEIGGQMYCNRYIFEGPGYWGTIDVAPGRWASLVIVKSTGVGL